MPDDAPPGPDEPDRGSADRATAPLELADGMPARDLLAAVGDARVAAAGAPLHLVGRGSSAVAVLSLALHQRRLGLELAAVDCVDGGPQDDPISGVPLPVDPPSPPRRPNGSVTQVLFIAGDDAPSRQWTATTAAAWAAAGWEVS